MFTWILTSVLLMLNLCLWIGNISNGRLLGNASIARGLTCCKKLARHEASRKSWSTKFPLGGGGKPYLASGLCSFNTKSVTWVTVNSPVPMTREFFAYSSRLELYSKLWIQIFIFSTKSLTVRWLKIVNPAWMVSSSLSRERVANLNMGL